MEICVFFCFFNLLRKEVRKIFKKKKKEIQESIQDWLPITSLKEDGIYLKNEEKVKILKVEAMNFRLKSESEQNLILESYKRFLKACNFDIQMIVMTRKKDISKHMTSIRKNVEDDENLRKLADAYRAHLDEILNIRGSMAKEFFVIVKGTDKLQEKVKKIKEELSKCGNMVSECKQEEMKEILDIYLNKRRVSLGG